jgi:hypothetical protein
MIEPTTIGLTESGHEHLQELKQLGHFAEMADAYRFAVALGLAHDQCAPKANRRTIFNVGTLDPDGLLATAIGLLVGDRDEPIYRLLERYAEWGVEEIHRQLGQNPSALSDLLQEAARLTEGGR